MRISGFKKIISLVTAALMLAALVPGCAKAAKRTVSWFEYFDTVITLTAYTEDAVSFKEAAEETEEVFRRYHRLFDIYNEYEDIVSLAAVNRLAGESVQVDPELIELIELGRRFEELTGGAVNIAMGAVLSLWHDARTAAEAGGPAGTPDPALLQEAAKHCGISDVQTDRAASRVRLADEGMSLDVGAIAKGFAADRAAEKLKARGFPFLLNCGGAVLAYGEKPGGVSWTAGIADPKGSGGFAATVELNGEALSTSGSYLRSFTVDGVEYGHIIDPETLFPAELDGAEGERLASVSVKCGGEGCACLADALSTACWIMGAERGAELVKRVGASAVFILADGETISVP